MCRETRVKKDPDSNQKKKGKKNKRILWKRKSKASDVNEAKVKITKIDLTCEKQQQQPQNNNNKTTRKIYITPTKFMATLNKQEKTRQMVIKKNVNKRQINRRQLITAYTAAIASKDSKERQNKGRLGKARQNMEN